MFTQPRGYQAWGQLKECERCGFAHVRWKQMKLQNGLWLCPECVDREDRRRTTR